MSDYAFVDMHIHTTFSHELGCDDSVSDVLLSCQNSAAALGRDCVISITDHNSILGSKAAIELVNQNKEKYPNVKIISGAEFSINLEELSAKFKGAACFTSAHILAYGFNENDEQLNAYSILRHFTRLEQKLDNSGMQIIASKRMLKSKYKIDIPYSQLLSLLNTQKDENLITSFADVVIKYCEQNNLKQPERDDLEGRLSNFMSAYPELNANAERNGRLNVTEVGQMVQNAGGELVLAHPGLLFVTKLGLEAIQRKTGVDMTKNIECIPDGTKGTILKNLEHQDVILNCFLDAFTSCTKAKLAGLERFHPENFYGRVDSTVNKICKERNLLQTGGSDYHGEHLHPNLSLGNCLDYHVQNEYKNLLPKGQFTEKSPLRVTNLSGVDHFLNGESAIDALKSEPKIENNYYCQMSDDQMEILYDLGCKSYSAQAQAQNANAMQENTKNNEKII